ncbi:hypothetical protein DFH28DRAFT_353809 [Melampsora americana]|nr:hypothetical protein DFH28DRAFT_353809 [Melampsora americana]
MKDDLRQYGNETVVKWVNEDWDRFGSLIENVLMAFLHPSLYTKGVASHFAGEDDYLDTILHNYRKREIPLSEFAIEVPMRLQDESILSEAIEKLNQLRPSEGISCSPSPISPEVLQRLFVAMDTSEEQTVLGVLMAKTPLESIGIMKQTIDCLVTAWTEHATKAGVDEEARRLTPDDLLALLACVIVRSGVEQQHSLIHYAKVFRLGATLTPETDWAFVSYQAAIAYLQSDPFSAVDSRSVNSQAVSVNSMPSSPSLGPGWTRRRPASFTPRTRPLPHHGHSSVISTTLSSPSASSIRLSSSTDQSSMMSSRVLPRHRPRPMGTSVGTRVSEAPRHLAGKVPPTRPALAPISTTDRCTRRSLDLGMLSAPMGSGESRACSIGWESLRSLSSIGETDPPTIRGGPSRSFHFPYSGPDVHPLSLERRNTSDWSESVGGGGGGGGTGTGTNREGWLEWGRKRLTSVTSLQMMGVGTNGIGSNGTNGSNGSLTPAMAALTRAKAQSTNEEEQEAEEEEEVEVVVPEEKSIGLRVRPKSLMSLSSLTTTTVTTPTTLTTPNTNTMTTTTSSSSS